MMINTSAAPVPAPASAPAPGVVPAAFSGGFTQLHKIVACGFGAVLGLGVVCSILRRNVRPAESLAQFSLAHVLPVWLVKRLPTNVAALSLTEAVLLLGYALVLWLYLKECVL